MPNQIDLNRPVQSIYPEPQAVTGLAAKTPEKFSVPVFLLSVLFFIPIFLVTAYLIALDYGPELTAGALASESIVLVLGLMLIGVVILVVLMNIRRILVRNASHPFIIAAVYLFGVVLVSFLVMMWLGPLYGTDILLLLAYQAAATYAMSLIASVFAWVISR